MSKSPAGETVSVVSVFNQSVWSQERAVKTSMSLSRRAERDMHVYYIYIMAKLGKKVYARKETLSGKRGLVFSLERPGTGGYSPL
jgi:hypothetical protein